MAITTGDFINTNRLKTSSGAPSQLNYGGTKIYRAYYGNQLIWDVWRTTLSANDFNIISKGGNVSDYTTVESYYFDALDNKNNLAYTFNPSSIGTRLETTSTTHNVKVTQTATGKSITIKATQAGAVYTASSTITTTQVAAKGGNSTVTVSWTLYKDGELYKTGTSTPTAISGTDVSGDNITCTIDGVTVKVPSAGKTTYSNARTVFNVMSWTFVADGKTFTGSGKVAVLQKVNTYTDTWNTPILTLTPYVTSINSKETPVSLKIDSYRTGKRIYTSTAETALHEDISANITTTLGSLSKESVAGKDQYSVLTIGNNASDKSRSATVNVTAGGYTATATITQSGRTLSSTTYGTPTVTGTSVSGTIPAGGGTVYLTVTWSQTKTLTYDNGTTSSSTITGSSTATVTSGVSGGGSISNGNIYAGSLGEVPTAAKTVYTITAYSFTANGKTGNGTGNIVVNQAANTYTDSWNTPVFNVTANVTNINASENPVSFKVNSYRTGVRTFTSGSKPSISEGINATISTTLGTLSATSISGQNKYFTCTIGANTSSSSRTAKVTVSTGANSKTITITQAGRTHSSTSYNTPTVKSTAIGGTIPASGGTVWLTVSWSQTQTLHYDNGTTSSSTVTGSSTATVTSGTAGGGSINGGGIYAASLGTTVTAARTVYTITSYSFTANGKAGTGTGSINVNQAENKVTNTTSGSYNLSISANSTAAMANYGGTRTITVGCTQNKTDKYSSGSTKDYTTNATATVSTNTGWFNSNSSLTSTTVTGSGKLTLTVLENSGATRTITVTAIVSNVTKTVSFTQNAVSYEFYTAGANVDVAYNATSVVLTGVSKKNGSGLDIQKAHVNVSGGASVDNYNLPTNDGNGNFTITLSFRANDTTKNTYTVIVTQPGSGKTITYTVTHAAKPQDVTTIYWVAGSGTWRTVPGGVSATAKLEYSSSLKGKVTVTLIVDGSTRSNNSFALSSGTTSGTKKQLSVNIRSKTEYAPDSVVQLKFSYGNQSGTITCSQ